MSNDIEILKEAFVGILKHLKVPMNETVAIVCAMESKEMLMEAYHKLKEGNFEQTPREAMRICGQVILAHPEFPIEVKEN